MAVQRVSEFVLWREGYAGAAVDVFVAGTNTRAALYLDEAGTLPAPNPQVLLTLQDATGRRFGKFAVPVYTAQPYTLRIDSTGETGVVRPTITGLAGEDASAALVTFPAATRTLAEIAGRVIHAENYGIFGAAAETNTSIIEAAIGAAAAAGGGVVVLPGRAIPVGNMTVPSEVLVVGQGIGVTTLQPQVGGHAITLGGDRSGMMDLTLDGLSLPPLSVGLYAISRSALRLRAIEVKRFEVGLHGRGLKHNRFVDLFVTDCDTGVKLHGDKADGESVAGGPSLSNRWIGGAVTLCRTIGADLSYEDDAVSDCVMQGVRVEDNLIVGVRINGARGSVLRDCRFAGQPTHIDIRDDDDTDATARLSNTVERTLVEGGSIVGGKVVITGTAKHTIFRGVSLAGVEVELKVPVVGPVVAIDCPEDTNVLITGDGTKWLRQTSDAEGTVFGLTTDATATQAWSTVLQPGETVYAEAHVIANQRNGTGRAVYHIGCGAYRPGGTLAFDAQVSNFTLGDVLNGETSGASARIVAQTDSGTTGTLTLRNITGTFLDNEVIKGEAAGEASAAGVLTTADAALDTVGNINLRTLYETTAGYAAAFAVTGGELRLMVTGAASTDMEWMARVKLTRL